MSWIIPLNRPNVYVQVSIWMLSFIVLIFVLCSDFLVTKFEVKHTNFLDASKMGLTNWIIFKGEYISCMLNPDMREVGRDKETVEEN